MANSFTKDRFHLQKDLLNAGKFFKLVCGAGNEDQEEVKRLTVIYTLAGAKGLDISASPKIVEACVSGIDYAFSFAEKFEIPLKIRPFITVSVGMPGDHHVRKAIINSETCVKCNLCIPVCPTEAIPPELKIIEERCIGCGNCSAICPVEPAIFYRHKEKELIYLLPECLNSGAENIELHAAVREDPQILEEWFLINKINPKNYNSMCLDRQHLSDFALEERIRKAKEIAGERLIIQADGLPMSGGEDDFNTTLQAVAIADIVNKRFNKYLDRKTKKAVYYRQKVVSVLLSGGTNSLTGELARQNDVSFQGVSIGTFARKIVKKEIEDSSFYQDFSIIKTAYQKAQDLIEKNIGVLGGFI